MNDSARLPAAEVRYGRFAFEFDLDQHGLALTGLCDSIGDVVMTDAAGRPLLQRAGGARKASIAVLQTLGATPGAAPLAPSAERLLLLLPRPPQSALPPISARARLE